MTTLRGLLLALALTCLAATTSGGQAARADDRLTLRIIVVSSVEAAQQVQSRLAAGADFAELARTLSIDPSAPAGGLLGTLAVSSLRPELRDALRGARTGDVTRPIVVPLGIGIFQVISAKEAPSSPGNAPLRVSSLGSVKYVLDVGGFSGAVATARMFSPESWTRNSKNACEQRGRAVAGAIEAIVRDYGEPSASQLASSPLDVVQGTFVAGQLYAYQGRMDDAIRLFEKAHEVALAHYPLSALDIDEAIGVAYLHRGAIVNGLHEDPGDRCLVTDRGMQPQRRTADAQKAIEHFARYLAARPADLEVRWLLNLAYMNTGAYPDQVPSRQLVGPQAFASTEDVGRFRDVAAQAGLRSLAAAGGLIVDDFDGDARLDVVMSSMDPCGPLRYFRGNADGTFTERSADAGVADQFGGLNIVHADYDNDGDPDLLVLRGGWEIAQRKSLLRNDGRGTFIDVTEASGLGESISSTQTAVWADIDNDGLLDLFVGNEDKATELFRNTGGGRFENIAAAAGVGRTSFAKAVAAADYNGDGWTDFYVSNSGGTNFLYRNNGDKTFTETAAAAGVPGPGLGFGAWFFDYDNDGRQDLFVASYYTSVDKTARTYLGMPNNAAGLKLYRNLGDGSFLDVSAATGLDKVYMPMGSNFGDIDNDGFLDIYLGTGNPSYAALMPSVLLRNKEGRGFVDVTSSFGTGELHKGHGVAFADLDNDGDEEILFEVGGATPGDKHPARLFENPGHGNDWINLKLTGTTTDRSALGARIQVTVTYGTGEKRAIHRVVTSGGSFGGSPFQQHVGLGKGARSVEVDVWWPASGMTQRFANLEPNQTLGITERADAVVRLERSRVRLGGSR